MAVLLQRGLGYEIWLTRADGRAGLRHSLAKDILRRATRDERIARSLRNMLWSIGRQRTNLSGEALWRCLEPLLESQRIKVVERQRPLPQVEAATPVPKQEYYSAPEPILADDRPTLTRSVTLVILDWDGDGDPIVNLPLYIDHRDVRTDQGKTDSTGRFTSSQLPPDLRWSMFSGRNPHA